MDRLNFRVPDEWVAELDDLVDGRNRYPSRSEALRHALREFLDDAHGSSASRGRGDQR